MLALWGRGRLAPASQQSQFCELPAHVFWHIFQLLGPAQVGWSVGGVEVALALKRTARLRADRDDFRLKVDPAAVDAIIAGHRDQVRDRLAAQNHPADHPVERTAVQQLIPAFGKHPGGVIGGVAPGFYVSNPALHMIEIKHADAQFDEMETHGADYHLPGV